MKNTPDGSPATGWRAAAETIARLGVSKDNSVLLVPLVLIALVTLAMLAAVIRPI